ncbi:hypothetical protein Daus18300_011768 [Diaporthe australafricana]|uniref:Uncharacterized protein n=1 Tax=Diaporthe australafricana TaxID=127596 RepID=A0ABR3W5M9_9PEZI
MTPRKKDHEKNREATIVYPNTSPELLLAYRIFGPGHRDVEKLDEAKNDILRPKTADRDGEVELKPVGEDIKKTLNVDLEKILAMYEAYKREIERMKKVERIHEKRKLAQRDGIDNANGDDSDEVEEIDPNAESSEDDMNEFGQGEDPYEQFYKDPALWLSKKTALTRQQASIASLRNMRATLDDIRTFYNGKMSPGRDLEQCIEASAQNLDGLIRYAGIVEQVILIHENKCPQSTWKSRNRMNDTFGERVPWIINKVYNIEDRVKGMKPDLAASKRLRLRLASAGLPTTTQATRKELRSKLVRFATLCLAASTRADFKKELEDEAKQWEEQTEPSNKRCKKRAKIGPSKHIMALLNE